MGPNKSTIASKDILPLKRELYTLKQLSAELGLAYFTVTRLVRQGFIKGEKVGTNIMIRKDQVYDYLDGIIKRG